MKMICTSIAVGLGLMASAVAAQDDDAAQADVETQSEPVKPLVQVTARDDAGKATHVSVDGREYALCSDHIQDRCISPRSAGFDWGRVELDYWPGQTASSLKERPVTEEDLPEESDADASTGTEEKPDAT